MDLTAKLQISNQLVFIARLSIALVIVHNSSEYEISSGICGVARADSSVSGRIVNGMESKPGEWPWQVLMLQHGSHICGGTLISEEWILTAAHCLGGDLNTYSFFVGAYRVDASGKNAVEVKAHLFICHKGFDGSTFSNDLCLIKLTESVELTDYIIPVCLPVAGTMVEVGDKTVATGWGDTLVSDQDGEILREAVLPVIDTALCKTWYGSVAIGIPDKHFCAGYQQGGTDTCQGDSGGPLVHQETSSERSAFVLRGITSFGSGCAEKQRPGVYVRVSDYLGWIDENMAAVSSKSCRPSRSSSCGGTIDKSTTFHSPANTERFSYPANTECKWEITAPAGYWLRFNFICYFLLSPKGMECDDYLSIINETGYIETFCGNELPNPYVALGNTAVVLFSTDSDLEYPGFIIEVEFIPPANNSRRIIQGLEDTISKKTTTSTEEGFPSTTRTTTSSGGKFPLTGEAYLIMLTLSVSILTVIELDNS